MSLLGIIGGRGLVQLSQLAVTRREVMRTPYGEASGALIFGTLGEKEVVFLARHGYGNTISPADINYRANIWALREAGVQSLISVASVSCIQPTLKPGDLLVPDQLIDYTYGRKATFFEGADQAAMHVDFTWPYSQPMRQRLLNASRAAQLQVRDGGVYGSTQGPRFETIAEVNRIERDGVDVIGMTAMPETILARELNLDYAALCIVANYAAGRGTSKHHIAADVITQTLQQGLTDISQLLINI